MLRRVGLPFGGRDLDAAFRDLVATRRPEAPRITLDAARALRERLSGETSVPVSWSDHGDVVVTRRQFEEFVRVDMARVADATAELIEQEGTAPSMFAGLYLAGGVCAMPLLAGLHRAFRRIPIVVEQPLLAVAAGAAVHGRPATAPPGDLSGLTAPAVTAAISRVGLRADASAAPPGLTRAGIRRLPARQGRMVAALLAVGLLVGIGLSTLRKRDGPPAPPPPAAPPPWSAPSGAVTPPSWSPARPSPGIRRRNVTTTSPSSPRPTTAARPSGKPSAAPPGRPSFRVPATFALVSAGGRCATPDEPRDEDETPVRLRTCSTDPAQRWRSADLGGGTYALVNVVTGKCLDLNTAPGTGGGLVQQWLCRDNDHQKWRISAAADGLVTLQVRITAECLAVPVGPDGPSDTVHKDVCRPSSWQQWSLVE